MTAVCEDCNGVVTGTNAEVVAQTHGLTICETCIESMDDELSGYEGVMRDEGYECVFDPERGFSARPIDPSSGLPEISAHQPTVERQQQEGGGEC